MIAFGSLVDEVDWLAICGKAEEIEPAIVVQIGEIENIRCMLATRQHLEAAVASLQQDDSATP